MTALIARANLMPPSDILFHSLKLRGNQLRNLLNDIPSVLLMGPGPSTIPEEIYRALRRDTLGHLDPDFIRIMDEIKALLRDLMDTANPLTLPVSGTGSGGMEACFVNLVEPGDRVMILVNGVFGQRMVEVAERLGAEVDSIEANWGTPIDIDAVSDRIGHEDYRIVAVVHAETSTGVLNPVQEIGKLVARTGALFMVDGVTSLGGLPVELDNWNVDAFYSGTQKCLSAPPGLAPVSFSPRAQDVISKRRQKVPNWYLDMSLITKYWGGNSRAYHHTAPINMLYSLYQALVLIEEEGKENAYARHRDCHRQLVNGLRELGIDMLVDPRFQLPMLSTVMVPDSVNEAEVRSHLRSQYNIEIGAGLGPLSGKVWRIGLMGHTARAENVTRFLEALQETISRFAA